MTGISDAGVRLGTGRSGRDADSVGTMARRNAAGSATACVTKIRSVRSAGSAASAPRMGENHRVPIEPLDVAALVLAVVVLWAVVATMRVRR